MVAILSQGVGVKVLKDLHKKKKQFDIITNVWWTTMNIVFQLN